jgi:dGTPase
MAWSRLLTTTRLSGRNDGDRRHRSPFRRDYDRILFSNSFRRLADKTQVFPMPLDDHVHTRLTHSLEAASIGRSLGVFAGAALEARGLLEGLTPPDVGEVIAAACLAHDLGNPPFGHVGEDAIREFFHERQDRPWFAKLPEDTRRDLLQFEGNAQAFALITRIERASDAHGLDLTLLTLGAFCKYPCASRDAPRENRAHRKKHGYFFRDRAAMQDLAERLGLIAEADSATAWCRHPFAFLTEIADDIAYQVLDLEDGLRLGLVTRDLYDQHILALCAGTRSQVRGSKGLGRQEMLRLASRNRAIAIDNLIEDAASVFDAHVDALLAGTLVKSLRKHMRLADALEQVGDVNRDRSYQSRDVLKLEIAGTAAIKGVLDALVPAALGKNDIRSSRLRSLLPDTLDAEDADEARVLRVVDHVSGMTDNYLLRLYRELTGIRLPGDRM